MRAQLNPMTVEMGDAITEVVDKLSMLSAADLRAVVIKGAGRAFSAGGDVRFLLERKTDSPSSNSREMMAFYKRFLQIRKLPVPIVACINGPAIGAGDHALAERRQGRPRPKPVLADSASSCSPKTVIA